MIFDDYYYPDPYTYYASAYTFSMLYAIVFWLLYLGLGCICAVVVYRDAKTSGRRMPALPWAVVAFLLPVIGLLIYFIMRTSLKGGR